jgi:hypothetical protein
MLGIAFETEGEYHRCPSGLFLHVHLCIGFLPHPKDLENFLVSCLLLLLSRQSNITIMNPVNGDYHIWCSQEIHQDGPTSTLEWDNDI